MRQKVKRPPSEAATVAEQDDGGEPDDEGGAHPAVEEEQGHAPRARHGHERHHGHHEGAEEQDGLKRCAFQPMRLAHAGDADDGEYRENAEACAAEAR